MKENRVKNGNGKKEREEGKKILLTTRDFPHSLTNAIFLK